MKSRDTLKVFDTLISVADMNLMPARRIKLTAMVLLFILLSLACYAAITLFPTVLLTLSGITADHPEYVRLTNSIIAGVCAAFLLWPREGGQLVGRWNDYAGVAFISFFVFYGVRFIAVLLEHQFPEYSDQIEFVTDVVVYLGSYLNNILFLAAARILLNKGRRVINLQPPTVEARGLRRLKQEWDALRVVLPRWYWVMVPVSLLALFEHADMFKQAAPQYLWLRFPDAVFSVYCLSWFAYAIWLSFHVRRRIMLAWLGFVLVLAYAAGQLVFASNPFIAYKYGDPNLEQATWVRNYLGQKVATDISKIADQLHKDARRQAGQSVVPGEKPTAEESFKGAKKFFDGAIFAILSLMKSLLFLPPFILYILSIISVNDFRQALRETTSKRQDYLSKDGILSVIGQSMHADEVRLIIRLPGAKRRQPEKEERVWAEVWIAPDAPPVKKGPRIYSINDDELLVRAMQTEDKEIIVTNEDKGEVASRLKQVGNPPQTLALIPIKFHGGVIGALKVIFRGYGKYNNGTLEQLKFMSELVAPSVQDFRTVSAVDKLGQRLIRALAIKSNNGFKHGNKLTDDFTSVTEKMVEVLYDLLSPLGICLLLECGFTSDKIILPKEGTYHDILTRPEVDYKEILKKLKADTEVKLPIAPTPKGPVRMEPDQLPVRTEKGSTYDLGTLILAIPDDKDEFDKPTLAAYYLTRRMLASLTAQVIFTAARNSLSLISQALGIALNQENLSIAEWFNKVEAACKKSGCVWMAALVGEGTSLWGRREHVEVVIGLAGADRENLMGKPIGCIPHRTDDSATHHIIHLQLKKPGHHLWLGVERAEFGRELNFRSPWRVFLENIANVAGTALTRIEERERAEAIRKAEEAERLKEAADGWVKTSGHIAATLMHQLVNMANNMLLPAEDLLERVGEDPLASDSQTLVSIMNMKNNAEMMLELTSAYNEIIEGDGHGSCPIAVAAQLAERLFRFELSKKLIEVEINTPSEMVVGVPSNIGALALASLMGNAIDAIQSRGRITIKAEVDGDYILCHVINDGPPIPEYIRPNIFIPGKKGKKGHSGWGLYLISRSLNEYGGEVELSYSNSEKGTCFTLRLPKSVN